MSGPRRSVTKLRCTACCSSILWSFASSSCIGTLSRPGSVYGRIAASAPRDFLRRPADIRRFSARGQLASDLVSSSDGDKSSSIAQTEQSISQSTAQGEPLPWYLQVPTAQESETPTGLRQLLPELPSDPPPLLRPLLEHVSVELGIDNLSLLDLRRLDPPSALGADMMMVIGTARSEKHVHVSADRLCRWLRRDYKIHPYADGLLGRNELKLKLRRKARRAKLLGSSGATDKPFDDGIRTGWVCVNVGMVEPDPARSTTLQPVEGVIGFGTRSERVRLVVQILTEEKRSELDLEGLWGKALEKAEGTGWEAPTEEAQDKPTLVEANEPESEEKNDSTIISNVKIEVHALGPKVQTRSLHTTSVRQHGEVTQWLKLRSEQLFRERWLLRPNSEENRNQALQEQHMSRSTSNTEAIEGQMVEHPLDVAVAAGDYRSVRRQMLELPSSSYSADLSEMLILRAQIAYLKGLPHERAILELGKGEHDYTSTPFLHSFYQTFPPIPNVEHWHSRVELHCYAIELAHRGYSKAGLMRLHKLLRLSGLDIMEHTLANMVAAFLTFHGSNGSKSPNETWISYNTASTRDFGRALKVLEDMCYRGYNVMTEDIFTQLHVAISSRMAQTSSAPSSDSSNTEAVDDILSRIAQIRHLRLSTVMDHFGIPFSHETNIIWLLTCYAELSDWDAFWNIWRSPTRYMQRRSATLYQCMWSIMAETQSQVQCIEALRTWLPEMDEESPEIELKGSLAEAVMQCVLVAHPDVEEEAAIVPPVSGEWVSLWRRCEAGLGSERG